MVREWLDSYPDKTRRSYRADWEAFFGHLGRKRLAAVDEKDVEAFVADAPTQSVRRRRLGVIKTFYAHATLQHRLPANPALAVRLAKPAWEPRSYRSVDERSIHGMLAAADKARDRVALGLIYTCALTADEVLGLKWADVDAGREGGSLNVLGKHARTLAIPAAVARDLASLRAGRADSDVVLASRSGGQLGKRQLNRILVGMGQATGVRDVSVGRLRNAYAQHALAQGIPLDEVHHRLGNRSYNSTAWHFRQLKAPHRTVKGRGKGGLLSVPQVGTNAAAAGLRDEDFAREAGELAVLEAAGTPSPAQRRRREVLRARLAGEVDRRLAAGLDLPPGHGRLPRNVPLDGEQIDLLLGLLEEAAGVSAMRIERPVLAAVWTRA